MQNNQSNEPTPTIQSTPLEGGKAGVISFLKDKDGNLSLRELVIFISLLCVVSSWIAQQFFHLLIPEYIFYGFVSLIGAGCFGYSIERKNNN